jgi:hypothetical protein
LPGKPGKKGLISADEMNKAMKYAAAFQGFAGGDPAAHAKLTGLMPQILGKRTNAKEITQNMAQMVAIFDPGGPLFSKLADQYAARVMPYVQAGAIDKMKGAALLSAFSVANEESPGVELDQFMRAVGGIGKTRKGGIEGAIPQGKYLQSLGINDKLIKATKDADLPFMVANAIAADLAQQKIDAKEKGDESHAMLYLRQKGFANLEETKALVHYAGMKTSGVMDDKFMAAAAAGKLPTFEAARSPVEEFQRTSPVAAQMASEVAEDAAQAAAGAGAPGYLASLGKLAFSRLADPNRKGGATVAGKFTGDLATRQWWNSTELVDAYKQKTQIEMQHVLFEEADRLGIKRQMPAHGFTALPEGVLGSVGNERYIGDEAIYALRNKLVAFGGNQLPGMEQVTAGAVTSLDREAVDQVGGNARGPLPGLGGAPAAAGPVDLSDRTIKALQGAGGMAKPLEAPRVQRR